MGVANTYSGGTIVSGGTLQLDVFSSLGKGGLTVNGGLVNLHNVNLGVAFSNTLPYLAGSGGTISDSSGPGTTLLSVSGASGATTFAGAIQNGPNSRAIEFLKYGASSLNLAGNNTYSGGTNVYGGVLALGNSNALGTGAVLADSGGTLDLAGYSPTVSGLSSTGAWA